MNAAVQVCWEKAARYLEVEERYWYCTADKYCLDPQEAVELCDENTIMVCAILGSTYTGEYEDVKTLNDLLMKKNADEGLNIHIHVDAASGGFVAPFVKPELVWDFRLPLVCGINVSGHKYGFDIFIFQCLARLTHFCTVLHMPVLDGPSGARKNSCPSPFSSPSIILDHHRCVLFTHILAVSIQSKNQGFLYVELQ